MSWVVGIAYDGYWVVEVKMCGKNMWWEVKNLGREYQLAYNVTLAGKDAKRYTWGHIEMEGNDKERKDNHCISYQCWTKRLVHY